MIGAKKLTWKIWCQSSREVSIESRRLQLAVQAALGLGNRLVGVGRIGEIDLDVILGAGLPRTVFRKRMARAGDDAPAGGGEPLHRGVADAAARSGQQQGTARLVAGGHVKSLPFAYG